MRAKDVDSTITSIIAIRAGQLRALAVTSTTRADASPDETEKWSKVIRAANIKAE
jgi:hypothetical protein